MYRRFESSATVVALSVFSALRTPVGETAYSYLRKSKYEDLLALTVNPKDYSCASRFRDDYLVTELMSKFDSFDLGIDRDKVALDKFISSEKQCEQTNKRLSSLYESGLYTPYSPESFIWTAREKIARLLGSFDWDECSLNFGFGPGASSSLRRSKGDAYFKFGVVRPHTTKENSLLSLCAVKSSPSWFSYLLNGRDPVEFSNLPISKQIEELFEFSPGNKVTTVAKNAKTNRVIAIEPDLNMYIQKGIGSVIRSRLKRVGINLDDQTRNQQLALLASVSNKLTTIDLSSASDTISLELVRLLLPNDWFEALKQSRSSHGIMPNGSIICYQKVSSMGNGFTFELESLLFWAICSSVISLLKPADRQLAVYGDDLIVSSDIQHTILWLLKYLGFTPNPKKTFTDGPFRESCGKHYFLGTDVTPFYIRKDITSADRLIITANQIRRWARLTYGLDPRLKICYLSCVVLLPKVLRKPSIPDGIGDLALFGDFDECRPKRASRQFCGWKALGYQQLAVSLSPADVPLLIRNLFILSRRSDKVRALISEERELDLSIVNLKSDKPKWLVVRPTVPLWESYGPWLSPYPS